jgi:hypothetical protein
MFPLPLLLLLISWFITDISNDSTHLECLACTSAQTPTLFCTQCCISKSPVPNHRHPMSNFVSASDIITFDPEVSVHGWDVRKSAIGITWYHHKGSKIKTLQKPKPLTPVTQPPVFRADSNLPDGWEEIKDPDGRLFYYHRATKVSKWTRPQNNQLAAGWTECTNPDGRTYYLNTITQATTWDRPVGSSPAANDERKSVTSAKSTFPDTTEWSPNDKRQSISSQGQSTATPQSPASIRSSTILETVEWSPTDIEKTTVPAHRAASVPNIVPTTTWTPSEPTLRPIPTRAETQPQYGEWQYDQSGHRQHSRTFSKEALASGSATATKAVVKSTKTAANATAKGVKSAAKKLKESKNAQRIVAGVGMAAVNSVLINQFGISIPTSVGTAAVGLVNAIDFEETTAVVDVTNADVVEDDDVGDNVTDNVDVSGYMNQGSTPDGSGDAVDVNQMNTMPGNDYVVGGENAVVETTTIVPEEIIIMPAAPLPMVQQPQPILSAGSYSGPQHINPSAPQHAAPGPIPGSADWEFSNMQRPAAMIASHIPIRYPARPNQGVFASAPASGMQTQKGPIHPGAGQHQNPSGQGHGNFGYAAQSHIPVHVQHAAPIQNQPHQQAPNQVHNPGLSQASHQPQWANQPQIHPQQPQAHQAPRPQQGQMPNQQHIPQGNTPNQQQSPQYQMPNKPQGQFPNPGHAQATQNQNSNQQQRPPGNSNQKKPLLKPHQKAALMNAGMKIGTSLLKSAIRSSMSGNSDGNDYDYNDNDNSFDSTDNSNFDMRDSDFSNDTGNGFDTNDNFDNGMVDGDTQGQDQDQFTDANQQFDNSFNGNSYDAGNYVDTTDYGGNNQFVGSDNTSDNTGDANVYDGSTIDTQGMNTPGFDDTLSAQGGFNIPPNTTYDQQSDINQQAQGILPAPMSDDNAAMNGFFTTPDTTYNDPSAIYLQGQGVLQTSMSDDNAAMNGFFTTPDMTCNDPSDINLQGQGILQASMEDGNTAMNGVSSGPDTTFSQDAMSDSNGSVETNMAAASNFWTVDVPDTSTSQTTGTSQAYAGLTSASLSGPMTDYYDSFSSFGGDIPLDQDTEQGPTTPVNPSGSIQNGGFFQDSTLTSADQEVSSSLDQSTDMSTTPDVSLDQDLQSMNQSLDQSQDPTTDPTSQDGSIPNTPPEFPSTIPPTNLTPNTVAAGTISQLYDGSGYGNSDSESAGNTPVDTQPMTPPVGMAATKIAGPAVTVMPVMPLTPPAMPTMPTPDPMADPSLLVIGQ